MLEKGHRLQQPAVDAEDAYIARSLGRGKFQYMAWTFGINLVVNAAETILLTSHIGLLGALIRSIAGNSANTLADWLIIRRWEERPWLRPALRATGVLALVVVPLMSLEKHIHDTWLDIIVWSTAYLAPCAIMLLGTRALPIRIVRSGRAIPRATWRD